jgi:DNA-binding GntR family transcriptional regulator
LSIFAALKIRNAQQAEELMKTHILRQREVLKYLKSPEVLSA